MEKTVTIDRSPRILVIDDELSICQNCIKILSRIECEVEYALNGYDALRMMEAEPFEVIITDLKMSSLGGMEVLSRVKAAYPDTMVIVITGYASVSSAVEEGRLTTCRNRSRQRNSAALSAKQWLKEPSNSKTEDLSNNREIYEHFLTN
jgi:DNA-binding NtrC family response regulator